MKGRQRVPPMESWIDPSMHGCKVGRYKMKGVWCRRSTMQHNPLVAWDVFGFVCLQYHATDIMQKHARKITQLHKALHILCRQMFKVTMKKGGSPQCALRWGAAHLLSLPSPRWNTWRQYLSIRSKCKTVQIAAPWQASINEITGKWALHGANIPGATLQLCHQGPPSNRILKFPVAWERVLGPLEKGVEHSGLSIEVWSIVVSQTLHGI